MHIIISAGASTASSTTFEPRSDRIARSRDHTILNGIIVTLKDISLSARDFTALVSDEILYDDQQGYRYPQNHRRDDRQFDG
jgi:hypothetical protein